MYRKKSSSWCSYKTQSNDDTKREKYEKGEVPGIRSPWWRMWGVWRCLQRRRARLRDAGGSACGSGSRTGRRSGRTGPGTSFCRGHRCVPLGPFRQSPNQKHWRSLGSGQPKTIEHQKTDGNNAQTVDFEWQERFPVCSERSVPNHY